MPGHRAGDFAGGASCWSGLLPADFQQLAGLAQLTPVAILMTIASMGASMSLRQFVANWRVAAVAAMTYIGQVLAVFLVIGGLFGVNMAVGGLPGGMAAALIVQEQVEKWMDYLQKSGVLSGHIRGEYI